MSRWADDPNAMGAVSMTAAYRSWIGPSRAMALAIDAAVTAAWAADITAFEQAEAELNRVDHDQLRMLLGQVSRDLFERAHPDGLDSDDAEQALRSCAGFAAGWFPQLDPDALVVALTGALGVSEPDDAPGPGEMSVVVHGLLLIADQLRTSGLRLEPLLDSALRELRRAQTVEMP